MTHRTCLSIILAAGEGTRMKSAKPKVLHEIAGLPMVAHVAAAAKAAGGARCRAGGRPRRRRGPQGRRPLCRRSRKSSSRSSGSAPAHAVLAARAAIARGYDDILVMFGDTPLIEAEPLLAARKKLAEGAAVVVVGFRPANPAGYGRLIEKDGKLVAIREDKDASEAEKKIDFCNGGLMAIAGSHALALLDAVGNDNAKGEYYLTDIVEIAHAAGLDVVATEASSESVLGINNRAELAEAEAIWQRRRRRAMMLSGVTLIAPETVYFSHDTEIGAGHDRRAECLVRPRREDRVRRHDPCLLPHRGRVDRDGRGGRPVRAAAARRGPAREGKGRQFLRGQEGDDRAGRQGQPPDLYRRRACRRGANIGAGTITCNYDGYRQIPHRHRRRAPSSARTRRWSRRSRSAMAPMSPRAASSPKTCRSDALAFGRARQKTLPGKGKELRERFAAAAAAKKKAD